MLLTLKSQCLCIDEKESETDDKKKLQIKQKLRTQEGDRNPSVNNDSLVPSFTRTFYLKQ